jgi:hypothetical protein
MPTEKWKTRDKERSLDDPFFGYLFGGATQIPGLAGLRTNESYPGPQQDAKIFETFVATSDAGIDFLDVASHCAYQTKSLDQLLEAQVTLGSKATIGSGIVSSVVYQPFVGALSFVDELGLNERQTAAISSDLRSRVMGFSMLVPNWDGEGAEPISLETISTALHVIEHIAILLQRKNTSSKPSVRPFPDGSIFLKWIQGQKELAITVRGREIEGQHWEPLDSFQSQGLWEISVGDIPEHIEWVLT